MEPLNDEARERAPNPNDQSVQSQIDFSIPDRSLTFPPISSGSSVNESEFAQRHRKQHSTDTVGRHDNEEQGVGSRSPGRERAQRKHANGQSRICGKCGQPLLGQFVRALGDTYHLECFTCTVGATSASRGRLKRASS